MLIGDFQVLKRRLSPLAQLWVEWSFRHLFILFQYKFSVAHGWGITYPTDIAFSLGIASLFGKRIPAKPEDILMALAIIDDLEQYSYCIVFRQSNTRIFLLIAAFVYGLLWLCNYRKSNPGILQSFSRSHCGILSSMRELSKHAVAYWWHFAIPVNCLPKLEIAIFIKTVNFFILPLFCNCQYAYNPMIL